MFFRASSGKCRVVEIADSGQRVPTAFAIPVREATLGALRRRVRVPTYDRRKLQPRVVHIGVGGFHRAHQAVYLDDAAEAGVSDWGIVGVGLRSWQMGVVLRAQDCLYALIERDGAGSRGRVVGSILDYLHGGDQPGHVLDALTDPDARLVTLTITGNGYNLDENGVFVEARRSVINDLTQPERPSSVFGFLVEALDRRRRAGLPGLTVLSCDNIPQNGAAARAMVLGFAELRDGSLARWIEENVAFPSCVVDRITPETKPEERDELLHTLGVDCRWPVITEPFSQWVIEDAFPYGRPPLDHVGAQFVGDVGSFELVKKRLLNGVHSAIGYLGYLGGYRTTAEVMADPSYAAFVRALMDEIVPLLPSPPGLDVPAYADFVFQRLANPAIADDLSRLCRRGSVKMPSYLLPSLHEAVAAGAPHPFLTLATAGWFRYLLGEDYAGNPIEVEDPRAEELVDVAQSSEGRDPRPLLQLRDIFGDLGDSAAFVTELERAIQTLRGGAREAVDEYLDVRQAA
jgi:mannitol 2-dehydrogenase